jgi:flagellar motility protein MotE (MotC chaperone)
MGTRPLLLLAVLLGGLLALKSLSLLDEAGSLFAERAFAAVATAAQEEEPPAQGDAAREDAAASEDDAEDLPPPPPLRDAVRRELPTASRLGLERNLAVRRRELDEREEALDTREQLLVVAEQRVDDRIGQLEALRDEVQGLLGQLDSRREEQIGEIVNTYMQLEPDAAANIFTAMRESDPETLFMVAERYQSENPRKFSQTLAEMQPIHAAELTTNLRARAEALEAHAEAEVRRAAGEG